MSTNKFMIAGMLVDLDQVQLTHFKEDCIAMFLSCGMEVHVHRENHPEDFAALMELPEHYPHYHQIYNSWKEKREKGEEEPPTGEIEIGVGALSLPPEIFNALMKRMKQAQ